jgi:Ni,Fe-hydrogenase III small subunit
MSKWVLKGLQTGIKTTSYPEREELASGVSPGLPGGKKEPGGEALPVISRCPTYALRQAEQQILVDYRRCIHCFRCVRGVPGAVDWNSGYEWAGSMRPNNDATPRLEKVFGRSLHILFVDGGACGACMSELEQINKPFYNIHRLGFFITPTPREADILLVAGPVTDHMELSIQKAFAAMPTPKRVLAVGACALSGGIFSTSFASDGGVPKLIRVDVGVPGCPPPPLAIIHGLLLSVSRKPSASLMFSGLVDGRKKNDGNR